ncbi:MAG: hypothetical protein TYPL_4350 [Candidatus Tyloplasma litorale]|nr:MAG: hypothetical protein TYPL_4350 [Mycoplasmatales bacterium]
MKNRTLVLLHGFKKNGVDDFLQLYDFFKTLDYENIYNEDWFDTYDKSTLNKRHVRKYVDDFCERLNKENYSQIDIIGYSTGSIVAVMIKEKLKCKNVKIFSIVPPIKIKFSKWIPVAIKSYKAKRRLKKKLGSERYKRIREISKRERILEKHALKITIFINNLRLAYRSKFLKEKNIIFLLAENDEFIKTQSIKKILSKKNKKFITEDFSHTNILTKEKEIFINWYNKNI